MKVLVYGAKGWVASYMIPVLEEKGHEVIAASCRADDEEGVRNEIASVKPSHVLSLIGRTHGEGFSTIDYLEQQGKLVENVRDNLFSPVLLAHECKRAGVHFSYLGTGCIFSAPEESGKLYNEDSKPDFFGSSYSVVKGFTDRLMHLHGQDGVLNARIRMPITADMSPRNFVAKIASYAKVCSIPNSMSVLPVLLPYMVSLMESGHSGTVNLTNPGVISHNEILEMYRDIVDPQFQWENFSEEEQNLILLSKRSNNHLDTSLLQSLFPDVPDIKSAVRDCLVRIGSKD
jgi:nucleoside-diphosphate-sugar epimerase